MATVDETVIELAARQEKIARPCCEDFYPLTKQSEHHASSGNLPATEKLNFRFQ